MRSILLLLCVAVAADNTASFTEFWKTAGNADYRFYDDRTFGAAFTDPCIRIYLNPQFRALVNAEFDCTGLWCMNGAFACPSGDSRGCYNVEHIVDTNGGEFLPNQTNIAGNLVMAWGRWNQENGRLAARSYADAQAEKQEVYGADAVERAKDAIRSCNGLIPAPEMTPGKIAAIVLAILAFCVAIAAWAYRSRKIRQDYASRAYWRLEPISTV